nr:hypothetical protein CFP56_07995 [Quercus suber]
MQDIHEFVLPSTSPVRRQRIVHTMRYSQDMAIKSKPVCTNEHRVKLPAATDDVDLNSCGRFGDTFLLEDFLDRTEDVHLEFRPIDIWKTTQLRTICTTGKRLQYPVCHGVIRYRRDLVPMMPMRTRMMIENVNGDGYGFDPQPMPWATNVGASIDLLDAVMNQLENIGKGL